MTLHRDDRPRVSRGSGLLARLRQTNAEDRIGWGAMLMGGGVGLVGLLVAVETAFRWTMGLVATVVQAVGWMVH